MTSVSSLQVIGAALFALAVVHTFSTRYFEHLAHTRTAHAGVWHLLGEVEATCDRVAFIRQGRVLRAGTMAELSAGQVEVHLKLGSISTELLMELAHWGGDATQETEHDVVVKLQGQDQIPELNAWLVGQGVEVYALNPRQSSLEDLFLQIMGGATADELNA